jgi:hypothetical protein
MDPQGIAIRKCYDILVLLVIFVNAVLLSANGRSSTESNFHILLDLDSGPVNMELY